MFHAVPNLPPGCTLRPPLLADAQALVDLKNACSIQATGQPDVTVEDTLNDWNAPGYDMAANERLLCAADGRLLGYIGVDTEHPSELFIDPYVHPDQQDALYLDPLYDWALHRSQAALALAPADARVAVQAAVYSQETFYLDYLARRGFQTARHFWRMKVIFEAAPPAPHFPPGITWRSVRADEDWRPVLAARRAAFQDHFGYIETAFEQDYESWSHYWRAHFQPGLWLLALDGEQIAGVALCRPDRGVETEIGWVSTLGVDRAYRRRGIALALLYLCFETFYTIGKQGAALGVDAASPTGATELYRRAGMQPVEQMDFLEKELRPGYLLSVR